MGDLKKDRTINIVNKKWVTNINIDLELELGELVDHVLLLKFLAKKYLV